MSCSTSSEPAHSLRYSRASTAARQARSREGLLTSERNHRRGDVSAPESAQGAVWRPRTASDATRTKQRCRSRSPTRGSRKSFPGQLNSDEARNMAPLCSGRPPGNPRPASAAFLETRGVVGAERQSSAAEEEAASRRQ
eukprot:scaffold256_cov261-Pinguiococcus_pyrenoidosus.AAC.50